MKKFQHDRRSITLFRDERRGNLKCICIRVGRCLSPAPAGLPRTPRKISLSPACFAYRVGNEGVFRLSDRVSRWGWCRQLTRDGCSLRFGATQPHQCIWMKVVGTFYPAQQHRQCVPLLMARRGSVIERLRWSCCSRNHRTARPWFIL